MGIDLHRHKSKGTQHSPACYKKNTQGMDRVKESVLFDYSVNIILYNLCNM